MPGFRILCSILSTSVAVVSAAEGQGLTIAFVANEGVLLSSGSKKVLIDGLFRPYGPEYAVPADSTQARLEAARAPFDSVTVLLVTHRHGDHFHPAPVAAHLLANPGASLLTSAQVIDSLRGQLPANDRLASRLLDRTTPIGARRAEVIGGIRIELLGLPHAGQPSRQLVEHLGYIVDLGGRRVLHVGDTEGTEADFAPFRLDTARIDVALLPVWMMTSDEGRRVIERWIKPRQIVAFHLGSRDPEGASRSIRAAMPEARPFARSLEQLVVP